MDAKDNKRDAAYSADEGSYYSLPSDLWMVEEQEFAGAFLAVEEWRNNPNGHYRELLAGIGLAKQHVSVGSDDQNLSSKLLGSQKLPPGQVAKKDPFGVGVGEDAQQVPDSPNCAPSYGPILQAVVGIDIETLPLEELKRAVDLIDSGSNFSNIQEGDETGGDHDEAKSPPLDENDRKKWVKKILRYIADGAKFAVKNLNINKLRMPGPHKVHYDTHPSLLTIPCCSLDQIREWTPGTVYPVLIIASEVETYEALIGAKAIRHRGKNCQAELATSQDLAEATGLLRAMVKAQAELASGQRNGAVVDPIDLIKKDTEAKEKMEDLQKALAKGRVKVPIHAPAVKGRVLKLFLEVNKGYTVPDPMLVLMKAAINWYFIYTEHKLASACGPPVDPEKAEIEALNDELHEQILEEVYNEKIRPQTWEDLAKGLGQWTPSTPEQGTSVPRVYLSPDEATKKK